MPLESYLITVAIPPIAARMADRSPLVSGKILCRFPIEALIALHRAGFIYCSKGIAARMPQSSTRQIAELLMTWDDFDALIEQHLTDDEIVSHFRRLQWIGK